MSTTLGIGLASRLHSSGPTRRLSLRVAHDVRHSGLASKHPRPFLQLKRQRRRQCSHTGLPDDAGHVELCQAPGLQETQAACAEADWQPAAAAPAAAVEAAASAPPPEPVGTAAAVLSASADYNSASPSASQPTGPGTPQQHAAEEPPPLPPQQEAGQQPQGQQEMLVPWGLATTITVMVVWLLAFWLAAYSLVPTLVEWLGMDPRGAGARLQAFKHFLLDFTQLGLTVGILWRGLAEYHPRSLGLFSLSLKPWRSWVMPTLAGLATFPAIDWLHRTLMTLLAVGDDYLLSGTVEQIAGTSDWVAHALWFAVLGVCAPLWEEAMFRGFLLPSLCRQLPRWGAVLASALVFSLVHFTREGFLPLLLLGLVFGGVYVHTRSLWPPILLHSLWNAWLLAQILLRASATL